MPITTTRPGVTFETGQDLRRLASCRRDRVRFVEIPEKRYLAIDGTALPGSPAFIDSIGELFKVAYPLHFALRARGVRGHRVGMLEALFWISPDELTADWPEAPEAGREWRWRLLLAVPDEATEDDVDEAIRAAGGPAVGMYLDRWAEGPSAQILHVGSYERETPTLRRLHAAIAAAGLRPHGAHHEIYLNDPQRVGEDRTKTVLRQPVEG